MDVAMKIVGRIGFPVAVKNISKKYVHKYKSGKVILNVQTEGYLKTAIMKVGWPVLIQRMVDSPFEIIIGAKRDHNLGVMVTFGWGGVFAEDLDDLALRILPLTEGDLDEMIKETKIGRILVREKVDLSGIKNVLIDVCQIMTDFSEIQELDLNPLKITAGEIMCVDARYK
jgi:acetyltransferase